MVVVQDDPDQTALFLPGRVLCGMPIGDDGIELRLPDRSWHHEIRPRAAQPILSFAWPETPYAVLQWVEDERPVWYVNLEDPIARTPIGFDTVDHALDVIVEVDGSSWRWKDEDELEHAIADGLFTEEEAVGFRRWGERARDRIVAREPPFDRDWSGWRPDPGWPLPELPEGWDRL